MQLATKKGAVINARKEFIDFLLRLERKTSLWRKSKKDNKTTYALLREHREEKAINHQQIEKIDEIESINKTFWKTIDENKLDEAKIKWEYHNKGQVRSIDINYSPGNNEPTTFDLIVVKSMANEWCRNVLFFLLNNPNYSYDDNAIILVATLYYNQSKKTSFFTSLIPIIINRKVKLDNETIKLFVYKLVEQNAIELAIDFLVYNDLGLEPVVDKLADDGRYEEALNFKIKHNLEYRNSKLGKYIVKQVEICADKEDWDAALELINHKCRWIDELSINELLRLHYDSKHLLPSIILLAMDMKVSIDIDLLPEYLEHLVEYEQYEIAANYVRQYHDKLADKYIIDRLFIDIKNSNALFLAYVDIIIARDIVISANAIKTIYKKLIELGSWRKASMFIERWHNMQEQVEPIVEAEDITSQEVSIDINDIFIKAACCVSNKEDFLELVESILTYNGQMLDVNPYCQLLVIQALIDYGEFFSAMSIVDSTDLVANFTLQLNAIRSNKLLLQEKLHTLNADKITKTDEQTSIEDNDRIEQGQRIDELMLLQTKAILLESKLSASSPLDHIALLINKRKIRSLESQSSSGSISEGSSRSQSIDEDIATIVNIKSDVELDIRILKIFSKMLKKRHDIYSLGMVIKSGDVEVVSFYLDKVHLSYNEIADYYFLDGQSIASIIDSLESPDVKKSINALIGRIPYAAADESNHGDSDNKRGHRSVSTTFIGDGDSGYIPPYAELLDSNPDGQEDRTDKQDETTDKQVATL